MIFENEICRKLYKCSSRRWRKGRKTKYSFSNNKKMQNKVNERDTCNKDKGRSCMMRKWKKYRPMFEDLYISKSNLPVCTQFCLICN